jgi:hypothetical protein
MCDNQPIFNAYDSMNKKHCECKDVEIRKRCKKLLEELVDGKSIEVKKDN